MIDRINEIRAGNGLPPLAENAMLTQAAHTQELITSNFSFDDLVSDLGEVFIEATRTAESMALWTGEHLTGLASPVETDEDVLIDLMLQRVPPSVESIRLKVEFVEPRFQWSNEVEIDPFDELD